MIVFDPGGPLEAGVPLAVKGQTLSLSDEVTNELMMVLQRMGPLITRVWDMHPAGVYGERCLPIYRLGRVYKKYPCLSILQSKKRTI